MPITVPMLDTRRFADLRDEALARIPVHTPEWTHVHASDPGVTLIEVFAFLTESLLYRANQIPERNRRAFLRLLGVPLQPATSAQGLVSLSNATQQTVTLNTDIEVFAGSVPFRTIRGLDVLPIEARAFYKRRVSVSDLDARVLTYYEQLYETYNETAPNRTEMQLYETTPLLPRDERGINLARDSVDGTLWLALLAPPRVAPADARLHLYGKTLSIGMVPALTPADTQIRVGDQMNSDTASLLRCELPKIPTDGILPQNATERVANYYPLDLRIWGDPLREPGILDVMLPNKDDPVKPLGLWSNLDPLEAGVGDFPPALEDTALNERLITWIRIRPALDGRLSSALSLQLVWVGINVAPITQRTHVNAELLPDGTGEPDQSMTLAHAPVIPATVELTVTVGSQATPWTAVDDLAAAGPEVVVADPRQPPGSIQPRVIPPSEAFAVDYEAGAIRFGDGYRGKRPPLGATIRANYDYGLGQAGNVAAGTITNAPALPNGITVTNPLRTWGGADAETVAAGEKQVTRYLQHRDRLVTQEDMRTIAWRTPGIALGRVEVLPAFHPDLSPNEPGDAPGVVTLMVIPSNDPLQPAAPQPDRLFLDTLCRYLSPRRLVTTELVLRGPIYKQIWISVGIDVKAGTNAAVVREAVKSTLLQFLAPLPPVPEVDATGGWPLRKAIVALELLAIAARVPDVLLVNGLLVAQGTNAAEPIISMVGLELPYVMGISVSVGDPQSLDDLRGIRTTTDSGTGSESQGRIKVTTLAVPLIPEECR